MKKLLLILIWVATTLMLGTACGGTPSTTTTAEMTTTTGSSETTTSETSFTVNIKSFAFVPATITVPVGSTVTWTNNDTPGHDVKGDTFQSPLMAKGETFQYKFEKAGTYNYVCGVHPAMKGVVIVQ